MANIEVRDGANLQKFLKAEGAGSNLDPFIPHHESNLRVGGAAVSSGNPVPVSLASIPLPSGAATEATLLALSSKLSSLGQKTMANSAPVVIASDQSAVPSSQSGTWDINNISGTISLPTGAATSANQTNGTQRTKLSDGTNDAALSLVGGSYALKVDVVQTVGGGGSGGTSLADMGSFTEGTTAFTPSGGVFNETISADPTEDQAAAFRITAKRGLHVNLRTAAGVELLGQQNMAASIPVALASNQSAIPVSQSGAWTIGATQSGTWNIGNITGTVSLPTGAATEATLSNLNSKLLPLNADFDTGAGTDTRSAFGILLPASGGAVLGGTSTNPLRIDPTGTTTQPISAASLPLPTGAATETTLSGLSAKFGSLGQKTMANSAPVVIASDQSAIPASQSGTWNLNNISGTISLPTGAATESTLGSIDGKLRAFDLDSGAGTQNVLGISLRKSASGGSVEFGTSSDPLRIDPTGTTTQPISAASLPLPSGAATSAIQTDGTQRTKLTDGTDNVGISTVGGAKALKVDVVQTVGGGSGGTSLADKGSFTEGTTTFTPSGGVYNETISADPTEDQAAAVRITAKRAFHVNLRDASGVELLGQKTMAGSIPVALASNQSAIPVTQSGTWTFPSEFTDRSSFTDGTSKGQVLFGVYNETGSAPTEDQAAAIRITGGRGLQVNLRNAAGSEVMGQQVMASSLPVTLSSDQSDVPVAIQNGETQASSLSALNAAVTMTTEGTGSYGVQITGTFSATLSFEATIDGTNWFAVNAAPIAGTSIPVQSTTTTGQWVVPDKGFDQFRVRVSSYTSGTAVVSVIAKAEGRRSLNSFEDEVFAYSVGNIAHDGVDSGSPIKIGGKARQSNPATVSDGDRVDAMFDDAGKQVTILNGVRDVVAKGSATLTSTTETTLISAAGVGTFIDIITLIFTNSSSTPTRVEVRDATGGSVILTVSLAGNGGAVINLPTPLPQTTANNNWTVKLSTAVTSVYCFGLGMKNPN